MYDDIYDTSEFHEDEPSTMVEYSDINIPPLVTIHLKSGMDLKHLSLFANYNNWWERQSYFALNKWLKFGGKIEYWMHRCGINSLYFDK